MTETDVHGTVAPALTQIASTANIAVNANNALAKPRNREIDAAGDVDKTPAVFKWHVLKG